MGAYFTSTGSVRPCGMLPPKLSTIHLASSTDEKRTMATHFMPGLGGSTLHCAMVPYAPMIVCREASSKPSGRPEMKRLSDGAPAISWLGGGSPHKGMQSNA